MAKRVFARPFQGVRDKEIYPTEFKTGAVCPPELVEAAEIVGVLEPEDDGGAKGKGKGRKSGAAQTQAGDGTDQEPSEVAAQTQSSDGTGQTSAEAVAAAAGSDQGQA